MKKILLISTVTILLASQAFSSEDVNTSDVNITVSDVNTTAADETPAKVSHKIAYGSGVSAPGITGLVIKGAQLGFTFIWNSIVD